MLIGLLKNGPISIEYCIFRSSYVGDYLLYVNRWIHQMHQNGVWPIRELEVIKKDSTWTAHGCSDIGHVDVYPVVHPNVDILSAHQYEKLYYDKRYIRWYPDQQLLWSITFTYISSSRAVNRKAEVKQCQTQALFFCKKKPRVRVPLKRLSY